MEVRMQQNRFLGSLTLQLVYSSDVADPSSKASFILNGNISPRLCSRKKTKNTLKLKLFKKFLDESSI